MKEITHNQYNLQQLRDATNPLPGGRETQGAFKRLLQGTDTDHDREQIERYAIYSKYGIDLPNDTDPDSAPMQDIHSLWDNSVSSIEETRRRAEIYHGLIKKSLSYQERLDRRKGDPFTVKRKTPHGKMKQRIDQPFIQGMYNMAFGLRQTLLTEGYEQVVQDIDSQFNVQFVETQQPPKPTIIFEINQQGTIYQKGGDSYGTH